MPSKAKKRMESLLANDRGERMAAVSCERTCECRPPAAIRSTDFAFKGMGLVTENNGLAQRLDDQESNNCEPKRNAGNPEARKVQPTVSSKIECRTRNDTQEKRAASNKSVQHEV